MSRIRNLDPKTSKLIFKSDFFEKEVDPTGLAEPADNLTREARTLVVRDHHFLDQLLTYSDCGRCCRVRATHNCSGNDVVDVFWPIGSLSLIQDECAQRAENHGGCWRSANPRTQRRNGARVVTGVHDMQGELFT